MERWDDWNIPDDMITHAVNISVEKKLKADVKYIDGIITNWRKEGIGSVDAALRSTAEHAKKNEKPEKPSKGGKYDTNALAMQNFKGFLDGGDNA